MGVSGLRKLVREHAEKLNLALIRLAYLPIMALLLFLFSLELRDVNGGAHDPLDFLAVEQRARVALHPALLPFGTAKTKLDRIAADAVALEQPVEGLAHAVAVGGMDSLLERRHIDGCVRGKPPQLV